MVKNPCLDIIAERISRAEGGEMLRFPKRRKGRRKKKNLYFPFPLNSFP